MILSQKPDKYNYSALYRSHLCVVGKTFKQDQLADKMMYKWYSGLIIFIK